MFPLPILEKNENKRFEREVLEVFFWIHKLVVINPGLGLYNFERGVGVLLGRTLK